MSTTDDLSARTGRVGPSGRARTAGATRDGKPGIASSVRKRNAAATRAAILAEAKMQFCGRGYDNVGLRDVATAVGVDAALVSRYFGSKDQLFADVIAEVVDPRAMFTDERATLGLRLTRHVVALNAAPDRPGLDPILLTLRSASSPRPAAILRSELDDRFIRPLAAWLGGRDALARAALISAYLLGASVTHGVLRRGTMAEAEAARFVRWLAPALQALIDGTPTPSSTPPAGPVGVAGARAGRRARAARRRA